MNPTAQSDAQPRFAVLQAGARMQYAVPTLLARAGVLSAFYTDLHAEHLLFEAIRSLWPTRLMPPEIRRLLSRRLPADLPKALVRDDLVTGILLAKQPGLREASILSRALRERFAGATSLYTNFINNDLSIVRSAKLLGLRVIHELITPLSIGKIGLEERNKFKGIQPHGEAEEEVLRGMERDRLKWALCDRIIVPSGFCMADASELGLDTRKASIVPYGINEHWLNTRPHTIAGRVFSVGRPSLLKGTHILADACRMLRDRGCSFDFRVAGTPTVDTGHSLFQGPTYLGQILQSRVKQEYQEADIFVLPTLADSFGLAHLEAMACGVPVITTPNCGSVVRDGIEGFIVPIRDSRALADRIQQLIDDRQLRQRMSYAAKERAREFTWNRYGQRLLETLGMG